MKRSLCVFLVRALRFRVRLQRFVWISSRLWFSGRSEIESKSSQFQCLSPRHLSHPTFIRYKASYSAVRSKLSFIRDLLSWRSCHPQGRSLSTGIKAFVVTVGLTIIHIFTFDLSIVCYYFCSSPKVHWKSHKKSYSLLAVLLPLCCCVHQVASHHLHIFCVVFHLLSAPY